MAIPLAECGQGVADYISGVGAWGHDDQGKNDPPKQIRVAARRA